VIRTLAVLAAVLLLSGCTGVTPSTPVQPRPTASAAAPTPRPTASVDVPTVSASIPAAKVPVPPVRVRVASVGVDVEVVPVGVRADRMMELPANVDIAGWYRYGPDPSTGSGSTVIAAHVDSLTYGLGPFSRLKGAAPGAEILVTTVDGTEHRYTVESVTNVRKEELPVDAVFDRDGPERLVLITCGGQFDRRALRYSDNVLVTAVPGE
jgi:hypothetical protein